MHLSQRIVQCQRSSTPALLWLFLILLVWCPTSSDADIFSSSAHVQSLMHLERHLVISMAEYIERTEEKLVAVKRYLNEFATSAAGGSEISGSFSLDLMSNPLQAYQLIRRLAISFSKLETEMNSVSSSTPTATGEWSGVEDLLNEYRALMPSKEDLSGAALALIRLQDTYRLNATDMARGQLIAATGQRQQQRSSSPVKSNKSVGATMTARDCLYLGKSAFNGGYYGLALDWFDRALERAFLESNSTAPVDEILKFQQTAILAHDKIEEELQNLNFPMDSDKVRVLDHDNEDFRAYQHLCRGERLYEEVGERKWHEERCYYSAEHPSLKLNPAKIEQFSVDPYVVLFHDVMSPAEIDTLKDLAQPTLTRARVQTDDQPEEVSRVRVSATTWFSESSHPLIDRLNKRISRLTDLSVNMDNGHCELVQVANYGIGGHYVPHYDYLFKDKPEAERGDISSREKRAGDRIATFMIYLSDVLEGGSTVFTRLNIHVAPKPGAALFWYNLYRNGEGRIDTVHGACPVLMGEKWVANYWMREHGQTFRRPCTLNAEE